ncbi:MAG: sigma-54-dependent transcriptional regulator [Pseudobdellovibrio sp.]
MSNPTSLLNLLVVEDDQNLASSIRLLAPEGFKVYVAQKPSLIPDHVFFHAALVDMHLEAVPPETADGLKAIEKLLKLNPQTEIVAMSGNLDRKLMEKSIQSGAHKFLAKPLSAEELNSVLGKIEAYWSLRRSLLDFQKSKVRLLGNSSAIENLRKQISHLHGEKTPVLIEGETGVGKEVVAQLLNRQEGSRPFIAINCSAIPDNLFESEFFGHIKGSFTGADSNKIGYAEAAHGGDLFLDEIEALPLNQQAKLLRFLETGEIRKVGAKETQKVDVRLISASNIPLKELIAQKKFREDLYFRLSAHHISLLPLRQRKSDVAEIAKVFIEDEKSKRPKDIDQAAIEELQNYNWPGNIRELKRVCEQLLLTSPLPFIRDIDVKKIIGSSTVSSSSTDAPSLEEYLKRQEKLFIEHTLLNVKNDVDACADRLKVSKSNLYKKIKDLGIKNEQ